MSTAKKVFISIGCFLLIGVFAFLLIWGITNWNKVQEGISGTGLYTYSDLEQAKNEGYDLGFAEKGDYDKLLIQYKETVAELNITVKQLNAENEKLTDANEDYKIQIETLITSYEDKILELNNNITRLNGLLEGYEDIKNGAFEVNFYIDRLLYATKVVKDGNTVLDLETPVENTEYQFIGWSLNKTDVIDLTSYVITGNTTFYAITKPKYEANFVSQFEDFDTQYIVEGEEVTLPTAIEKPDYTFNGWVLEDGTIVDLSYIITKDTTFTASYTLYSLTEEDCTVLNNKVAEASSTWANQITIKSYKGVYDKEVTSTDGTVTTYKVFVFGIDYKNDLTKDRIATITFNTTYSAITEVIENIDSVSIRTVKGVADISTLSNITDFDFGQYEEDYSLYKFRDYLVSYYNKTTNSNVTTLSECNIYIDFYSATTTDGQEYSFNNIICFNNGVVNSDTSFASSRYTTLDNLFIGLFEKAGV